ncbi:amidohydrolase family protein [soil metagenome]
MKIIDVHAHILDRHYLSSLTEQMAMTTSTGDSGQTLLRKGNSTVAWYREDFFDVESRIATMDRLGIDMRILSLSSPSVHEWDGEAQIGMARYVNDQMARLCNEHPARFQGLAVLPLNDTRAALSELDRGIDELGLIGVAIGSNIGGKPLNHADLEPVWAAINRRRIPVVEHPMLPLGSDHMDEFELPLRVGFVYDTTTALARMIYAGVFERYPDFPFVIAHTGGALLGLLERLDNGFRLFPDCRKFISRLPSEYARALYYDTCSFYGPAIRMAKDIVGVDHLMWGADDPFIGAGPDYVRALEFPASEQAQILGGNAARVFKLAA